MIRVEKLIIFGIMNFFHYYIMINQTFGIIIAIIIVLFLVQHFEVYDVMAPIRSYTDPQWAAFKLSLKGDQGLPGVPGQSIVGPAGKDADINTIKANIPWCADSYCRPPTGRPNVENGPHRLKFDSDKVIRHHNLQDNHNEMGIASGTLWAAQNVITPQITVGGKLTIGNHEITSIGNELRVSHKTPNSKHVAFYADAGHSSMKTQRINNTDNWFGY